MGDNKAPMRSESNEPGGVTSVPPRLLVAYATGGFGLAVNSMLRFLLPLRAAELGIGIGVIGLLLGAKGLVEAFASAPAGAFMDRVGAKRAFVLGSAASAILAVLYGFASSVIAFLALQLILGLVRPLGWVGAQSYVAGLRTGQDRARDTGRMSSVATGAQIVAPLLVGICAQLLDLRAAFFVFAAYCLVFVVVGLLLPTDHVRSGHKPKSSTGFRDGVALFRLRGIRVAMLLTFARLWIPSVWASFFPLYLVTSGVSEGLASTVLSAMAVIATLVSLGAGKISKLGRVERVTVAGLAVGAIGLAISPLIGEIPLAYVGAVFVGIGQGLSLPFLIVIVSKAAPTGHRSLALGLRSSINQAASAIAPVATAAVIGSASFSVGFPLAGGVAGLFLLAAFFTDRRGLD